MKQFEVATEKQRGVKSFISRHDAITYPVRNAIGLYSSSFVDFNECWNQGKFNKDTVAITAEGNPVIYQTMLKNRKKMSADMRDGLSIVEGQIEDLLYGKMKPMLCGDQRFNFAFIDFCGHIDAKRFNWFRNELLPNLQTGASFGVTFNVSRGVMCRGEDKTLMEWRKRVLRDEPRRLAVGNVFGLESALSTYYSEGKSRNPFYKHNNDQVVGEVVKNVAWYAMMIYALINEHFYAANFFTYVYGEPTAMVLLSAHGLVRRPSNKIATSIMADCSDLTN